MKKDTTSPQSEGQTPDQVQTENERPQSPQPVFEPEQAQPNSDKDDIAKRAYALYEQRGRSPGAELDDWLQAERELRNQKKSEAA